MVEAFERSRQVLVAHKGELAGTTGLEQGLRPVGLRRGGRDDKCHEFARQERERAIDRAAETPCEEEVRHEEERRQLDRGSDPDRDAHRCLPSPDSARAQQVPHDEQRHHQIDLTEANRDEHGIEEQRGKAEHQGQPHRTDSAEIRLQDPQGEGEQRDQCDEVAQRPHRLDRVDGGERALPRGKEQRRKGGVGEQEAGVREPERIEVRREDVASAEAEVDTEVDFVGPQRDVEAVREGSRKRHQSRPPARQPVHRRSWAGQAAGPGIVGRIG